MFDGGRREWDWHLYMLNTEMRRQKSETVATAPATQCVEMRLTHDVDSI